MKISRNAIAVTSGLLVGAVALLFMVRGPDLDYPLRDMDGVLHGSLAQGETEFSLLFFLGTYCPISTRYAPEITSICDEYSADGVQCLLVYPEPGLDRATLRAHLSDFGHASPAILDSDQSLTRRVGAQVTPEAAVFSKAGELLYRGRIDDWYADLGRPRKQARQRDLRDALDRMLAGSEVPTPWNRAVGCFIEPLPG